MINIVEMYLKNEKQIEKLETDADKLIKQKEKVMEHIKYEVYREKISKLENERDKKIEKIDEFIRKFKDRHTGEVMRLNSVIEEAEKIVEYLAVAKYGKLEMINPQDVKHRDEGRYAEYVGNIIKEDYIYLDMFIFENRKPTNKYSLAVLGDSLFNESLKEHSYVRGFDSFKYKYGLQYDIKDFSTVEELKKYAEKNRGKLIQDVLQKYSTIKEEYEEAASKYKLDDFKPIIVFSCDKCGLVLTKKKADHYSNREGNRCPSCGAVRQTKKAGIKYS